jgi:hypothetical protein
MVFCFVQKFFSDNTRVRIYFFLSRKAGNFFPEFNIRLYDKNSESDYSLKWDTHINNILAKANKSLVFLRRNISKFPEEIKKRAYQAIVRPNVEYASSAWDPHQENHCLGHGPSRLA